MFILSVENTMAVLVTYKSICEDLNGVCSSSASPSMDLTHKVTLAVLCSWSLRFNIL